MTLSVNISNRWLYLLRADVSYRRVVIRSIAVNWDLLWIRRQGGLRRFSRIYLFEHLRSEGIKLSIPGCQKALLRLFEFIIWQLGKACRGLSKIISVKIVKAIEIDIFFGRSTGVFKVTCTRLQMTLSIFLASPGIPGLRKLADWTNPVTILEVQK